MARLTASARVEAPVLPIAAERWLRTVPSDRNSRAAIVATVAVGPLVVGELTPRLLLIGLGLAILLPLVPFTLELLALRHLTTAAFGTLMCLEPAIALLVGLVALGQVPEPLAVVGIGFVVVAGIGAERTGSREPVPPEPPVHGG